MIAPEPSREPIVGWRQWNFMYPHFLANLGNDTIYVPREKIEARCGQEDHSEQQAPHQRPRRQADHHRHEIAGAQRDEPARTRIHRKRNRQPADNRRRYEERPFKEPYSERHHSDQGSRYKGGYGRG